jgi:hypothetical protein
MRRNHVAAFGVAALTAVTVSACGSSGSNTSGSNSASSGTQTVLGTEISRAAAVSGAEKGYSFNLKMNEQVSGTNVSIAGTGSFSAASHAGQVHMTIGGLPGSASTQLDEIITKTTDYVKPPAQLASRIPGGKEWLALNLADVSKLTGIPGLSTLFSGSGETSDPAQFLKYLQAEASSVTKVGTAQINGVNTTEYKVVVNLSKAAASVPAAQRAAVSAVLAKVEKEVGVSTFPMTVYIDSANLVRRILFGFTVTPTGSTVHVKTAAQIDFLSYGAQPTPATPPASETLNLMSLLSELGSAGSGSGQSG